jgi:hypothetical protein
MLHPTAAGALFYSELEIWRRRRTYAIGWLESWRDEVAL